VRLLERARRGARRLADAANPAIVVTSPEGRYLGGCDATVEQITATCAASTARLQALAAARTDQGRPIDGGHPAVRT
jgi:hypothetical protein